MVGVGVGRAIVGIQREQAGIGTIVSISAFWSIHRRIAMARQPPIITACFASHRVREASLVLASTSEGGAMVGVGAGRAIAGSQREQAGKGTTVSISAPEQDVDAPDGCGGQVDAVRQIGGRRPGENAAQKHTWRELRRVIPVRRVRQKGATGCNHLVTGG